MSFVRLTRDNFEKFTLISHPKRHFVTSSSGATGSVFVYPRRSPSEKEVSPLSAFNDSVVHDQDLSAYLTAIQNSSASDISNSLSVYIQQVNSQSQSARLQKSLPITRFVPNTLFDDTTVKKGIVKNLLMPSYRTQFPTAHYAYTNYHTLNFFTCSSVPSATALIYPNTQGAGGGYRYSLSGGFTFEFYINPRYTVDASPTDASGSNYKAGCIMHLSSTYSLYLVTGSSRDAAGYPDGFKLALALSHSADRQYNSQTFDISSSNNASNRVYPDNFFYVSDDNALLRNHWHHVAVRWGTLGTNFGTGTFMVDRVEKGRFNIPSASINSPVLANGTVLFLGNGGTDPNSGSSDHSLFFNATSAARDGLVQLNASTSDWAGATKELLLPLNAELHEIKIWDHFRNDDQIYSSSVAGVLSQSMAGLRFYVPPFFTRESPNRTFQGTFGGVLMTPFQEIDQSSHTPFNTYLSFGVNGHYINLENFGRDFVSKNYPRLWNLTASAIQSTTDIKTCNDFLYSTASVIKRNVTVLPCDNGAFTPNFDLLRSGTFETEAVSGSNYEMYTNDFGVVDLSLITLDKLLPTASINFFLTQESGSLADQLQGPSPQSFTASWATVPTVLQRTRDASSNEVSFFNISNIFYGKRINPSSFIIRDSNISGTNSRVSIRLCDDGLGNLYRADSTGSHASWASVGNIFYNEGVVFVKSPNIPFFGKNGYEVELEGEQPIHIMKIRTTAGSGLVNSSSNPSYQDVSASFNVNDADTGKFVYITNVNFHDDNLNVVMRTHLAQPVIKRDADKIVIASKFDF